MYQVTKNRFDELEIRRAIMRMTIGSQVQITVPAGQEQAAADCALTFAKARQVSIMVVHELGAIVIRRNEPVGKLSMYPEIDALQVGGSHLFPFPPHMHTRVRVAASNRNQTGRVRYACTREGDQIRVTRLPMSDEEAAALPEPIKPRGDTGKYMLSRFLVPGARVTYTIPREQHYALRNSVSRYATLNNLRLRCRLQDDGSMLVYRVDEPAKAAG